MSSSPKNLPATLDRLHRAIALIEGERASGSPAARTLHAFEDLGASVSLSAGTTTLRYCGVTGSCTWSRDHGLLVSWIAAARRRIQKLVAA